MDRVYASGATGSAPSAPASPSTGYPTAGNPGSGTPATKPGPYWFHMITEELRKVITDAGLTPDHTNVTQLKAALDLLYGGGAPSGTVMAFAKNTAPTGYLKANGAAISRTTYAALFAVIGTTFGAGDGSTTFNVPDLRGEFIRGWDDGRGVDSGRAFGSSQSGSTQSHYHQMQSGGTGAGTIWATGDTAGSTSSTVSNVADGTETRPRNVALLACIKY